MFNNRVIAFLLSVTLLFGSSFAGVGAADAVHTLVGRVVDSKGAPIGDAVIVAAGTASDGTVTEPNGAYFLDLAPGEYTITAQKSGYKDATGKATIVAGKTFSLDLTLGYSAAVKTANVSVSTQASLNTTPSSINALPHAVIAERYSPNLNSLVGQLPGVTLVKSTGAVPDSSFVVRGGAIETRTQVDGHAVSSGAFGRFNSNYASSQLFDSIEVTSGAGINGPNSGESAFGIVNLRTRPFGSERDTVDLAGGADNFNGSYYSVTLTGNRLRDNKLSFVLSKNVSGYRGPGDGKVVDNVIPGPNNTAVVAFIGDLASRFVLNSEVAKLRYRFNPYTQLSLTYSGVQAEYLPQGGAYGVYEGDRRIVPSLPTTGGLQFNAPYAQNQIGTIQPTYDWFPNSRVQTNQPLFDAEFRTTHNNDTILLRPYVGTIYKYLDGNGRQYQTNSNAWIQIVSPDQCTVSQPCYVGTNPNPLLGPTAPCSLTKPCYSPNLDNPYVEEELDRLHGVTFTYIHPVHENTLTFAYDYHSDYTSAFRGDPDPAANTAGTIAGNGLQTSVAPTISRTRDLSLSGAFPINREFKINAGVYTTLWNLAFQEEDPAVIAAHPKNGLNIPLQLVNNTRTLSHTDPHIGLTLRPDPNTIWRLTAGSAITLPYAILVSGVPNIALPSSDNNFTGTLNLPNSQLAPESTVAYDLGIDRKTKRGTVFSADVFSNTIHNVFILNQTRNAGPIDPNTGLPSYLVAAQTINGPIQRNFGVQFSLVKDPVAGLGYRLSAVAQRAYYDELPASLYSTTASALINDKQLDGDQIVPFMRAFGELSYRTARGDSFATSLSYVSDNNYTYGPAFATLGASYRRAFGNGWYAGFSVDNIFNYSTGNAYTTGIAGMGYSTVLFGPGPGKTLVYSSRPTTLQSVPPRTFRFQFERHIGKN